MNMSSQIVQLAPTGPSPAEPDHLYGRSRESHALLAAHRRACEGSAELVLLEGPVGIGKTSLVRQFRAKLTGDRGFFISGKFDQLQRDVPFSAMATAIEDLVRQLERLDEPALARWRKRIQGALGQNGRVIADVVPALEVILGPQPVLPRLESTESHNRFKNTMQNFVRLFCQPGRPLVVFLDDMQWADTASLHLLKLLLLAQDAASLLVIASCRDQETPPAHPWRLAVKEMEMRSVPIETLALQPLGWADIAQLVADALNVDLQNATPLATMIRDKTAGNPFFIRQVLDTLHGDGIIRRDGADGARLIDLDAVHGAAISGNVADLIAQKIARLDAETRHAVGVAAAIGNSFPLDTLARVAGHAPGQTAELLRHAAKEGLIVESDGGDTLFPRFTFLHDRVQQAAYGSIPPAERPALNLAIGRTLLAGAEDVTGAVFDIVNHMNQAIELIDSRAERVRVAELNLLASTRARNSTAYDVAVRTSQSALDLLGWDAWQEHHALALEAHLRLAECQTLMANFEGAFRTLDAALPHVTAAADQGRLQTLRTHTYLSMGDMAGALACGRQAARLFGLELPEDPEEIRRQLQAEIGAIRAITAERDIEGLLDLPLMTDPDRLALMSVLFHCIPSAYQVNPQLFALICCKMVSLSIEHGNAPVSAKGYGSFGVILSGMLGNYRDADRFGKLGVDLCEKLGDIAVRSASYFTWAAFASFWMRPIDESIAQYAEGVKYGLQGGDHPHAAYCAARSITHQMFRGALLDDTARQAKDALQLLHRLGDLTNFALIDPRVRLIEWLRDDGVSPTLNGASFDENASITRLEAPGESRTVLSHLQTLRLMHRVLCGDFTGAWRIGRISAGLLSYSTGLVTVVEHNFYQSLAAAGCFDTAADAEREELRTVLENNQRQMASWSQTCPANFEHLHLAVEAERARLRGDVADARELFERARAAAAAAGFLNIVALVDELAFRMEQSRDPERAARHLHRAVSAYETWGAGGKARALARATRQ